MICIANLKRKIKFFNKRDGHRKVSYFKLPEDIDSYIIQMNFSENLFLNRLKSKVKKP